MGSRIALAIFLAVTMASTASAASQRTVIKVISTETSTEEHDLAPKGTSAGDWVAAEDRLTNAVAQFGKPKGVVVGSDRGVFRFVRAGVVRLTGTTRLPGGTLLLKGRIVSSAGGYTVPVVGGTGRYASARGSVKVVNKSTSGKVTLNVYTLSF